MRLKTLQWNIGGGRICKQGENATLPTSYSEYGLNSIIEILKREKPDVVTLQETHTSPDQCQTQIIAEALGYSYWVNDSYDESFIEKGQLIGQGVISRFPIIENHFTAFTNPKFNFTNEDGLEITSKNGGLTTCIIELFEKKLLQAETFHMTPFHFFNIDLESEPAKKVLREVGNSIGKFTIPKIIQADFNLDYQSLSQFLPEIFAAEIQEVIQEMTTTPKGKRFDHICYAGLQILNSKVISDAKTDHYPIVSQFQL